MLFFRMIQFLFFPRFGWRAGVIPAILSGILVSFSIFGQSDSDASPDGGGPLPPVSRILSGIHSAVAIHPEVSATLSRARALERGAENQARFPDPEISISRTEGSIEERGYYPSLSYVNKSVTVWEAKVNQPIPFPGKLTLKRQAVEKEALGFVEESRIVENDLAFRWLEKLSRIHRDRLTLNLTGQFERRARILADTIRTRYETGKGNLTDTTRARVFAGRYLEQVYRLRGDVDATNLELDYFGKPEGTVIIEPEITEAVADSLERVLKMDEKTLEEKTRNAPALRRLKALREAGESRESVASMDYLPDFAIFGGASQARGSATYPPGSTAKENYYSLGLSIRVPLWSALENGASMKETGSRTRSAILDQESGYRDLKTRVDGIFRQLQSLDERIRHYERELIPASVLARDSATVSYEAGRIPFTTVIDAWEDLYTLQKERIALSFEKKVTLFGLASTLDLLFPPFAGQPAMTRAQVTPLWVGGPGWRAGPEICQKPAGGGWESRLSQAGEIVKEPVTPLPYHYHGGKYDPWNPKPKSGQNYRLNGIIEVKP